MAAQKKKPAPKKPAAKAPSYETMRGLTDEFRMNQKNKDKQELEPKVFKKRR